MNHKNIGIWFFTFILIFLNSHSTAAKAYIHIPGVVHVHSTFSSGHYTIEELVKKAQKKQIEVLILTDHDLVVMEYGIPLFRELIKKREERDSVLKAGVEKYLADINRHNRIQKDVVLVPGVQSSPFYYWTGNPLRKNFTAHNYRKELLLIGMTSIVDYQKIPVIHRGLTTDYFSELLPRSIFFLTAFVLGIFLCFQKGAIKKTGLIISIFSFFLIVNDHPFKSSPYDPYNGDQGIQPYQDTIDYVIKRNGLVFWAHPESNYSVKGVQLGPIELKTEHYPDDLISSTNYTGFSALYGDTSRMIDPGRQWDMVLKDYCRGKREKPVWGIAGSDFHIEKRGHEIDTFQTVFLVREKKYRDILDALGKGRIYAMRKAGDNGLKLSRFTVEDNLTKNSAVMGEELYTQNIPVVSGRVDALDSKKNQVEVLIIRNGKKWQTFNGKTPIEFLFEDRNSKNGKNYYRLEVKSNKSGRLISNPIFVTIKRKNK